MRISSLSMVTHVPQNELLYLVQLPRISSCLDLGMHNLAPVNIYRVSETNVALNSKVTEELSALVTWTLLQVDALVLSFCSVHSPRGAGTTWIWRT